jgi:hypothetical protein
MELLCASILPLLVTGVLADAQRKVKGDGRHVATRL